MLQGVTGVGLLGIWRVTAKGLIGPKTVIVAEREGISLGPALKPLTVVSAREKTENRMQLVATSAPITKRP